MRLLLLTPTAAPAATGNAVTVERWRRGLEARGVRVQVVVTTDGRDPTAATSLRSAGDAGSPVQGPALDDRRAGELHELPADRETLRDAREVLAEVEGTPDVVHVHHAWRGGRALLDPAAAALAARPRVVTLAGTDVDRDLDDPARGPEVAAVLDGARVIAAQQRAPLDRLVARRPDLAPRLAVVPRAVVWLGQVPFDLRAAAGAGPDDLLVVHPAGVRPVKRNLEALVGLDPLAARLRYVALGPPLDPVYAARFAAAVAARPRARWLQDVGPDRMRAALEAADVVLNASASEGLSNALLEARSLGRPLLASDVPGNRGPLLPPSGPCGLLFALEDPADLARQARRLLDDPALRARLGAAGRAAAGHDASAADEAAALEALYRRAFGEAGAPASRAGSG